ncbi:hypothetical protein ACOSQ2_026538 [Xanthoceras sorbifolium]
MFEVLCVTWWRNWFLQNEATHSAAPQLSSDVVQWAASYLQDFKAAKVGSAASSTRLLKDFKWHPSAANVYQVNCDAGVDAAAHRTGIEVVIRDSSGFVLTSCAQGLDTCFSPQIAEALAIKRGLTLAIETGFTCVCLESDASAVVNLITFRCQPLSEISVVIADILSLLNSLESVSVSFVAREANRVTHRHEDCLLCVKNLVTPLISNKVNMKSMIELILNMLI